VNVEVTALDNGVKVVTERVDSVESAALGLWVSAGSRAESKARNGIAHFLEHMAFKGTKKRTSLQISADIESVGGYLNAYTSREVTAYYSRVLAEHVPVAVDIISDVIANSLFREEDIEVERGVIIQEINQSLDDPTSMIDDIAQECLYPNQPLGRPILGTIDTVSSFQRDDFVNFVKDQYTPERMIFSAAGKVDHNEIVELVQKGGLAAISKSESVNFAPGVYVGGNVIRQKDIEQVQVNISFKGASQYDDDRYIGRIYSTILGGGMSSMLFQNVREKLGLCYAIGSMCISYDDVGNFSIFAGTTADKLEKLLEVVSYEMENFADVVTGENLESARNRAKASLLMGMESVSNRCHRLAHNLRMYGEVLSSDYIREQFDSVTLDDVRNYSRKLLQSHQPCIALYGPVGDSILLNGLFKVNKAA